MWPEGESPIPRLPPITCCRSNLFYLLLQDRDHRLTVVKGVEARKLREQATELLCWASLRTSCVATRIELMYKESSTTSNSGHVPKSTWNSLSLDLALFTRATCDQEPPVWQRVLGSQKSVVFNCFAIESERKTIDKLRFPRHTLWPCTCNLIYRSLVSLTVYPSPLKWQHG